MQAIWDYEHEKMIDNAKEVKMLISMYKEQNIANFLVGRNSGHFYSQIYLQINIFGV